MDKISHNDLMNRLNADCEAAGMPPDIVAGLGDFDELGKGWKDEDRRMGRRRYELKVDVKKFVSLMKNFFGKS